jgi:hypothetical protein
VDCYLPYFRQQLITRPLSAHLPFQALFTESSCGDQLLASPPFSGALRAPHPLCCMFLFSYLFIIQFFFLILWGEGQSVQGVMLVYFRGGCVGLCLPSSFGADMWQHGIPPVFSV